MPKHNFIQFQSPSGYLILEYPFQSRPVHPSHSVKSAKKYGITRLSACVTLDPRAPTRMRFRLWVLTHFRITVKTCASNLRNYIFFPNTEAQLTLNRKNWIRASKMPRPTRFGLIKFYFIWCVIVYKGKNRCTASIHSMKDCNCPAKCQPPVRSRLLV